MRPNLGPKRVSRQLGKFEIRGSLAREDGGQGVLTSPQRSGVACRPQQAVSLRRRESLRTRREAASNDWETVR